MGTGNTSGPVGRIVFRVYNTIIAAEQTELLV